MSQEKPGDISPIARIIPSSKNLWETFYAPWYERIDAYDHTSGDRPIIGTTYLGGDNQDIAGFMIPSEGPTLVLRTRLWGEVFDAANKHLKVSEIARMTHDALSTCILEYDLTEDESGLTIAAGSQLQHLPWSQENNLEGQPKLYAKYLTTAESVGALLSRSDVHEKFIQLDAHVVDTLLENAAAKKQAVSEFQTE